MMNEATIHANGDTHAANGTETADRAIGDTTGRNASESAADGALATERQEARIRLEEAQRDHAEKLTELNRLANAITAKERAIARENAALEQLRSQHQVQAVRTAAAHRRVEGAQSELDTVMKDKVRNRTSGTKGKGSK